MAEWLTIRVVLADGQGIELDPAPGRVMIAHADHTFADLAEAVDAAFGRWDPAPDHEFDVEGRLLASDPGQLPLLAPGASPEDSDRRTLGEVGLRPGSRFRYLFDRQQRWIHGCTVQEAGVDPFTLVDEEPEYPVPVFGWGDLPDQYGRIDEDDEPYLPDEALAQVLDEALAEEDEDDDLELVLDLDQAEDDDDDFDGSADWPSGAAACWTIVARALDDLDELDGAPPEPALGAAVTRLRQLEDNDDWPSDVLWAAAGLDDGELPDSDEEVWLELAAGVVAPRDAVPLDPEREEAWAALEPADWAGAVIGLVRSGAGQEVSPAALLRLIAECDEVDAGDLDDDEEATLLAGFGTVMELWRALGVVDDGDRLTDLGRWGLPRALHRAWT